MIPWHRLVQLLSAIHLLQARTQWWWERAVIDAPPQKAASEKVVAERAAAKAAAAAAAATVSHGSPPTWWQWLLRSRVASSLGHNSWPQQLGGVELPLEGMEIR